MRPDAECGECYRYGAEAGRKDAVDGNEPRYQATDVTGSYSRGYWDAYHSTITYGPVR